MLNNPELTMEEIPSSMSELKGQFANAHAKITTQQGASQETLRQFGAATQELARINQLSNSTTNKNYLKYNCRNTCCVESKPFVSGFVKRSQINGIFPIERV